MRSKVHILFFGNVHFVFRIIQAAVLHNKYIATAKPLYNGRFELLHYLKEQSISYEYHRYGSITEVPED